MKPSFQSDDWLKGSDGPEVIMGECSTNEDSIHDDRAPTPTIMSTEGAKLKSSPPAPREAERKKPRAEGSSAKSLSKKASLNAIAAGLDFSARLIVGLVLQPLLVGGLGNELYGAWKVLGRMTGYVSAAGGRPTQALKWTIASHQSSSDFEEKRRRVATAVVVWMMYLPLLALVGGLAAWFIPVVLNMPLALTWTVRLAAAILIGRTVLSGLVTIPRAVMRGENLEYKRMGLSTLLVFVGGGLMALAVFLDSGLVGVAMAYLASTLLTGALFLYVVRTNVPWFGLAKPSWQAIRRFCGLSWWFLIGRIVRQLMIASDVILLGVFGSLELVTAYSLTKYVAERLINSVSIVTGGAMPGLGGIIGAEDYEKAKRVRSEIMLLTWLIAAILGSTILLWNQDFVSLWVGPQYAGSSLAILLILLMAIQLALIRVDAKIIDLTLDLSRKTIFGAVSAVIALLLAGVLVAYFNAGIPGLCAGFIVGRLLLSFGYPLMAGRRLGVPPSGQAVAAVRPAITMAVLFSVIWILNTWCIADTWFELVTYASVTFVTGSVFALFVGLSVDQRNRLWRRINKGIGMSAVG